MRDKIMTFMLAPGLAAIWMAAAPASAQEYRPNSNPPVTLPHTYEHSMRSEINDREYRILVALPHVYATADPQDTTRYRSLYLLDGEVALPLFTSMYRLSHRRTANSVVLIGVGYKSGDNPWEAPPGGGSPAFRGIDYTPPPMRDSVMYAEVNGRPWGSMFNEAGLQRYGGAPTFLRILREEVIPFIESRYRVSADRGLHGHSYGGLFATYALFHDPDLFTRYAITSLPVVG